jgi:hypothetical protein
LAFGIQGSGFIFLLPAIVFHGIVPCYAQFIVPFSWHHFNTIQQEMRTLIRSVIYLSLISACNNHRKTSDEIMEKFDSVSNSLEKTNNTISQRAAVLYDSIAKKYSASFAEPVKTAITQCRDYLVNTKAAFIKHCGGNDGSLPPTAEDKIDLTNSFFTPKDGPGWEIYFRIIDVQRAFISHNAEPELDKEIKAMTDLPLELAYEQFTKKYFKDVPPVAAITMINKFENDISRLEVEVLKQYLSK